MAYKVIILYQLYMPSYFLGTFTEYPYIRHNHSILIIIEVGNLPTSQIIISYLTKILHKCEVYIKKCHSIHNLF